MTVSAGDKYTMVLDAAGNLYGCGTNTSGQLGTGSAALSVKTLTRVGAATDRWVAVSAGGGHVAAIKADGSLWAWGYNSNYQLGIGAASQANQLKPVRVGLSNTWEQISAGYLNSVGVSERGELYAWGFYALVGNSTSADRPAPGVAVFTNAKPGVVVAGDDTSLEVRSNGDLYTWGDNSAGQLGLGTVGGFRAVPTPTPTRGWIAIAGGRQNNYGIKADGSLWSWGGNAHGELGFGDQTPRSTPTKVSAAGWTQVSACADHVFALRADGTMYAWGANNMYQLGDGTVTTRLAPVPIGVGRRWVAVACGAAHGIALASDGNSYSWGDGSTGVLGIAQLGTYKTPTQSSTANDYVAIGTDFKLSAGLTVGGDLYAWGSAGFVGDGTTSPRNTRVPVGTGLKYLDLTVGTGCALARVSDGSVVGWGGNFHGQLGDGTRSDRLSPSPSRFGPARSLSLTRLTTLSLDPNGTRAGAGDSTFGQVGTTSGADVLSPATLAGNIYTP
jgi:alpha-tubulin suppressor-like RCC1 family protein